jgi:hypothetical protein
MGDSNGTKARDLLAYSKKGQSRINRGVATLPSLSTLETLRHLSALGLPISLISLLLCQWQNVLMLSISEEVILPNFERC